MKKTFLLIAIILLTSSIFSRNPESVIRTVYSQNFESATFGSPIDTIGGIKFESWAEWGTVWTKTLDETTPISGAKSLKLDMATVGDWWSCQVSLTHSSLENHPIDFKAGHKYRMTYKIRAAAATTIKHSFHKAGNAEDYEQNVVLAGGNVVETKIFTTPVVVEDGLGTDLKWAWMLGAPGIATVITIDDIVIEELGPTPNKYVESFEASEPDYQRLNGNAGMLFLTYRDYTDEGAPYSNSTANLSHSIDTSNPISGTKSLKMNLTDVGNDWWAIQMRMENLISYNVGNAVKISYKIKSDVASSFLFESELNMDKQTIFLAGANEVQSIEYTSPVSSELYLDKFYWYFGRPSVPCTMWIDDIVIEELTGETSIKSISEKIKVLTYTSNDQLKVQTSENCVIELVDILGKKISSQAVNANEITTFSISNLKGFVLVKATDNEKNSTVHKVIL